jgi:hypothetical protein
MDDLQAKYQKHCTATGEFFDPGIRADLLFSHLLDLIRAATGWGYDELYAAVYPDEK